MIKLISTMKCVSFSFVKNLTMICLGIISWQYILLQFIPTTSDVPVNMFFKQPTQYPCLHCLIATIA